jgi:hypothetical protein
VQKGLPPIERILAGNPKTLQQFEDVYKKSFVSKTLPSIFTPATLKERKLLQKSVNPSRARRLVSKGTALATEGLTNIGIAAVDPLTAGVNVSKRLIASEGMAKTFKPVRKLQTNLKRKLVQEPIQEATITGIKGAYKKPGRLKRFIRRDVINPLTADISQTAGEAANLLSTQVPQLGNLKFPKPLPKAIPPGIPKVKAPSSFTPIKTPAIA